MLLEELRNELFEEKAEHSRTMALLREAVFNVNELSSRPPQAAEEIRVINGKNTHYHYHYMLLHFIDGAHCRANNEDRISNVSTTF